MKNVFFALILTMPAVAQQGFDLKSLDRLGANAKNATNVTLDRNMLKLAANFLGNDDDSKSIRALVRNLDSIYVRIFSFDKPGQYNEADLGPFRAYLAAPKWNRIVESKSTRDASEVFVLPLPNNQLGGVAIISLEATEVTVVYINGIMNPADVGKLSGTLGIPNIKPLLGIHEGRK
jgi:hypothetical protein